MHISTDFECGSIDIIQAETPDNIQLNLRSDNNACIRQWFYFQLTTKAHQSHTIKILNAGKSTFPKGWDNYETFASYDQNDWFRVPTQFDGKQLTIEHQPRNKQVYYAYFVPYSLQRHQQVIEKTSGFNKVNHTKLGQTRDGNSIDLLTIGQPCKHKKKIWIIARQHPGETMAQWFVEGLIESLLSDESLSQNLLESALFYIVPNMNPDGSIRGNHRTNASGINLNRRWHDAEEVDCPEVFHVRNAMLYSGVDLFIDVHGDEEIPYNFIMAEKDKEKGMQFKNSFASINPDFQTEYDYNTYQSGCGTSCCQSSCGNGNSSKATDYVGNKFNCQSLLLEMSFKAIANTSSNKSKWSHIGCLTLGASMLKPIADFLHIEFIENKSEQRNLNKQPEALLTNLSLSHQKLTNL